MPECSVGGDCREVDGNKLLRGARTMKYVLSIGQCAADAPLIANMLRTAFDAETVHASTETEALEMLRGRAVNLVLVNRILDADGTSGIELVQRLKADQMLREVPVMLVSNYPDAQQQAVAAGALPGFGKGALHASETVARLQMALGRS
jgi:two-component system chemotaxis response regulator CheY